MTPRFCFRDDEGQLWFKESLTPSLGNSLRVENLIYAEDNELQHILLFDNETHGRVLAIDGLVQVSLSDEFIYHEMVTHVPLIAHGQAKSVLVIGGGDGGAMREILRHPDVERIVLVEIDRDVIDFSRKWIPEVSQASFDDPRVEVVITDGVEYMKQAGESFDLIIIDSSDPVGPSAVLFTPAFYASCKTRLNADGILVTQNGIAAIHPDVVRNTSSSFRDLFAQHSFYQITVPTFAGGVMVLGFGTDNVAAFDPPAGLVENRFEALDISTRYYTPAVHRGAFGLPRFIDDLIQR